jgi:hypothetical protein
MRICQWQILRRLVVGHSFYTPKVLHLRSYILTNNLLDEAEEEAEVEEEFENDI